MVMFLIAHRHKLQHGREGYVGTHVYIIIITFIIITIIIIIIIGIVIIIIWIMSSTDSIIVL